MVFSTSTGAINSFSGTPRRFGVSPSGQRVEAEGGSAPSVEIIETTVSLTAGQIIDLGTVPVQVIAAPGSPLIVMPLRVVARFKVGSTPIADGAAASAVMTWSGSFSSVAAGEQVNDPFGNALFYGARDQTIALQTSQIAQNDAPINAPLMIQTLGPLYVGAPPADIGTCTLTITYARFPA